MSWEVRGDQLVKHKDTGLYLCYIYLSTWLEGIVYMCDDVIEYEETEKKQWENNVYFMRRWLRQPIVQLIVASYPEPYEHVEVILKIWGGNCNIFLNLIFLFFDNEEACDCNHMTCLMIWDNRPRLGKIELEEAGRIMSKYISIAYLPYGWCIDIRVGLFIISMDHVSIV